MAGGLAEAQERFEDLDFGFGDAVFADFVEQCVAVVLAEVVVEGALTGLEFAVEGLLDFGWEFGGYLLFGAAQEERAEGVGEEFSGVLARISIWIAAGSAGCADGELEGG